MNYSQRQQETWENKLGCKIGSWPLQYLGVPLGVLQKSMALREPLINKFKRNIGNWTGSNLNLAGKLVLIMVTLDSLPIYWFNFFKMPKGIQKQIDRIRRNFLWERNKIHLTNWSTVTRNKQQGGLGVTNLKNLEQRNLVMLGKNWWHVKTNKDTIFLKVLKVKYGIDHNKLVMEHNGKANSTFMVNLDYLRNHNSIAWLFDNNN